MIDISIVVAMTSSGVIGKNGTMPWHLPEDLKNFKKITDGCAIVMGSKTWKSIPKKFRPLTNRFNIVLTRNPKKFNNVSFANLKVLSSFEDAISGFNHRYARPVKIIGGAEVYKQALQYANKLQISFVNKEYEGDTYFPEIDWKQWKQIEIEEFNEFNFVTFVK